MDKSVSVIIPVFNASRTLERCLASVFAATYKNYEVVVVDDASADDSVSIAGRFPCRLLRQKENRGPAAARNLGAREAKGEILFFIDSDTEMFPETMETAVKTLSRPDIDAVVGVYAKEPLNKGFFPAYYCLLKHLSFTGQRLQRHLVFASHCAAIKRDAFFDVGGFKDFPWGMDIENEDLGRRLLVKYNIVMNADLQVKHHFAGFRKLLYIFNNRTYWWVKFFLKYKKFEPTLTTKSVGLATVAGPAAFIMFLCALAFVKTPVFWLGFILFFGLFLTGFLKFFAFVAREKGFLFGLSSFFATWFFSFIISYAAARAFLGNILFFNRRENECY